MLNKFPHKVYSNKKCTYFCKLERYIFTIDKVQIRIVYLTNCHLSQQMNSCGVINVNITL